MEEALKDEFGLSRRAKVGLGIVVTAFLTLTVFICFGLYFSTKQVIVKQVTNNITNISQLNEDSISRAIVNRKILLEMISDRLRRRKVDNTEVILRELEDFAEAYDFYNMGLLDEDAMLYMINGRSVDASNLPFIDRIQSDDFYITESYQPLDGGKYMVNMLSYPLYFENGKRYHLVAAYFSKNLTERMNITSLEGDGHTFILDSQGKVMIFPQYYEDEDYNALMNYVNDTPEIIPDESGDAYFEYNDENYYAHFEKMEINDWYLMTCARESDVFSDVNVIIRNGFMAIWLLWILIIISTASISYNIYRSNKERRQFVFYDSLLNIGNGNSLAVVFRKLPREALENMYLVIFDIDKFKEFNYLYGEEQGDRLLKYIVQVFQEEFPDIYLFRYFSDYFITLDLCKDQEEYEWKIKKILDRFARDIEQGRIQPFEISAGVKKVEKGESLRRIISDALIARGTIKGNHLRHHAYYNDEIRFLRVSYMEMESDFSRALREKEFRVYYQPKYDIRTGKIIGAEALTRWVKADGTLVSPGTFIPCFEESRQIILLDEYILKEVCRQMKAMQSDGLEIKPVSVNLSRVHLRHPDILPKISAIIGESGIDPTKLSFEITESALLEESIPVKEILDYLHALGCRVDMDDYGVSASNPDALISNNFDTLKLDKSFVDRIGDERAEDLIRSTAHMVMKWGIDILAEGVEEKYQAERLVELGCSCAQGFYYSKPVPEKDYRELLQMEAGRVGDVQEAPERARCFSEDICAVLDGNLLPTYIIDPERFVVMYCNQTMRRYIGEDPTGGLCYQKMRKKDKPCENCSAMRLYRDGDNSPKEVFSHLGVWVILQTSPLYWQGREYVQITCVDISRQKQMEAELSLRSKEYEAIVQQSVTGIMRYNIATDTATVNVNRNLERVEEHAMAYYVKNVIESDLIASDSVAEARAIWNDVQAGVPSRGYEICLSAGSESTQKYYFEYVLIPDDKGKPYRAVISFYSGMRKR